MRALSGKVVGKVQGVGFRMYMFRQADRLGLHGWVSNNPNGDVDFYCEGSDVDLSFFIDLVKRGNDHSVVKSVEYQDVKPENLNTFTVI